MKYTEQMHVMRTAVVRDMKALHPSCALAFRELAEYLRISFNEGATHSEFRVFETYRNPIRQLYLLEQGVSKAGAFQSAHQFGMAVDFVPGTQTALGFKWSWSANEDWPFLKRAAELYGLSCPIAWDKAHVQVKDWEDIRKKLP